MPGATEYSVIIKEMLIEESNMLGSRFFHVT